MAAFLTTKKTYTGLVLALTSLATFGTYAQTSEVLKSIKSNTSSVTKGSSSGAANITSSSGSSATYNSGIDWTKANSVPWKGLNWSAGGTIPQARIPRLSEAQLPTSMPNSWKSQVASVPRGAHCGFYTSVDGSYSSCLGYNPKSSCPSGYAKRAYSVRSSIKNPNLHKCSGSNQSNCAPTIEANVTHAFCVKG